MPRSLISEGQLIRLVECVATAAAVRACGGTIKTGGRAGGVRRSVSVEGFAKRGFPSAAWQ